MYFLRTESFYEFWWGWQTVTLKKLRKGNWQVSILTKYSCKSYINSFIKHNDRHLLGALVLNFFNLVPLFKVKGNW